MTHSKYFKGIVEVMTPLLHHHNYLQLESHVQTRDDGMIRYWLALK